MHRLKTMKIPASPIGRWFLVLVLGAGADHSHRSSYFNGKSTGYRSLAPRSIVQELKTVWRYSPVVSHPAAIAQLQWHGMKSRVKSPDSPQKLQLFESRSESSLDLPARECQFRHRLMLDYSTTLYQVIQ